MKEQISPFEYAPTILGSLAKGILLTSQAEGKVNTMTIGWGTMGIEWQDPVFITFVRENRFTRSLLDKNPAFTINVPYGQFDRKILNVAGLKSGRDLDKITALGLHLEEPEVINVPGIRELPLTLECEIVYSQLQDKNRVLPEYVKSFYPADLDFTHPLGNRDYHIAYYGKIVAAYIIK